MTVEHVVRQAEGKTKLAHFVFEEIAQRFKQFEAECFGQAADVVVTFDGVGFFAFAAARFNHVRVDGALGEPAGVGQFARFALEDFDKFAPDDFAFGFGVGDTGKLAEELLAGIHMNDFGV